MAVKLHGGEKVLLCRLRTWHSENAVVIPNYIQETTYLHLLETIYAWTKIRIGNISSSDGLFSHLREIHYSLLIHLESSRKAYVTLVRSAPMGNDEWVTVNCEFNVGVVSICACYDLLGHLYAIINDSEYINNNWQESNWDFLDKNGNVYYRKYKCLPNIIKSKDPVGHLPWTLTDAIEHLRHRSTHGNYDYIVIRRDAPRQRPKWVVVDPTLSFRDVCRHRDKASTDKVWDKVPATAFVCENSSPLAAEVILESLMSNCLKVWNDVLKFLK